MPSVSLRSSVNFLSSIILALSASRGFASPIESISIHGKETIRGYTDYLPSGTTYVKLASPIVATFSYRETLGALNSYNFGREGYFASSDTRQLAPVLDPVRKELYEAFLRETVNLELGAEGFRPDPYWTYTYIGTAYYQDPGQQPIASASLGTYVSARLSDELFSYQIWGGDWVSYQGSAFVSTGSANLSGFRYSASDVAQFIKSSTPYGSDNLAVSKCLIADPNSCERYTRWFDTSVTVLPDANIPEPGTTGLLAAGLCAIFLLARIRRQ